MAEPALTLRDHPQIIDLISVLEQSGLQKQKEEVQALVGYIDGMEEKLSQMMDEMKEMRLEVGKLHDKGIRARCSQSGRGPWRLRRAGRSPLPWSARGTCRAGASPA